MDYQENNMTPEEIQQQIDESIAKATAFSTKKIGDTPTDDLQLTPKGYVSSVVGAYIPLSVGTTKGDIIVYSSSGVVGRLGVGANGTSPIADSTQTLGIRWGSVTTNLFGDGLDGDVTVSSPTIMTRDMYFNNLTISGSTTLSPSGFKIYVKGVCTIGAGCSITTPGTAGTNASGATAGTGGTGVSTGTLPGSISGINGTNGGTVVANGNGGQGVDGLTATDSNPSIGVSGTSMTGKHGGAGGSAGSFVGGGQGTGSAGGTATLALNTPDALNGCFINADLLSTYTQHKLSASSGGAASGGGGAGNGTSNPGRGGGSGGGGSCGGVVAVYANTIINNAHSGIKANGGNGGNGGNGDVATSGVAGGGGGGGGGCGGSGGVIILVYKNITNAFNDPTSVTGGAAGTKGVGGAGSGGGATGNDGQDGNAGATGNVWSYQV